MGKKPSASSARGTDCFKREKREAIDGGMKNKHVFQRTIKKGCNGRVGRGAMGAAFWLYKGESVKNLGKELPVKKFDSVQKIQLYD